MRSESPGRLRILLMDAHRLMVLTASMIGIASITARSYRKPCRALSELEPSSSKGSRCDSNTAAVGVRVIIANRRTPNELLDRRPITCAFFGHAIAGLCVQRLRPKLANRIVDAPD